MFDQFSYGYLGFTLGPDGQTLYYLTGGPVYVDGKRVAGKSKTAMGESKGIEDLHLDHLRHPHGRLHRPRRRSSSRTASGPSYVNSIAVGKDGTVYALSRITRRRQDADRPDQHPGLARRGIASARPGSPRNDRSPTDHTSTIKGGIHEESTRSTPFPGDDRGDRRRAVGDDRPRRPTRTSRPCWAASRSAASRSRAGRGSTSATRRTCSTSCTAASGIAGGGECVNHFEAAYAEPDRREALRGHRQRHQRPFHLAGGGRHRAGRRGDRASLHLHRHDQRRPAAVRPAGLRRHRPGDVPDRRRARSRRPSPTGPRPSCRCTWAATWPTWTRSWRSPGSTSCPSSRTPARPTSPSGGARRSAPGHDRLLQLPGHQEPQLRRGRRDPDQRRRARGALLRVPEQQPGRTATGYNFAYLAAGAPTCG